MAGKAIFKSLVKSEHLTMRLIDLDDEKDVDFAHTMFTCESANGMEESKDPVIWTPDLVRRSLKALQLSPHNCLGLEITRPALYIVHEGNEDGHPFGFVTLMERSPAAPPDFGYALLPEYRRKGYGTEAARTVLDYWKNDFGLKEIMAFTMESNHLSKKLLRNLGFEAAGHATLEGVETVDCFVLPGMKHFSEPLQVLRRFGRWEGPPEWLEVLRKADEAKQAAAAAAAAASTTVV